MPLIGTQQSPIRIEHEQTIKANFGPTYLTFGYTGKLPGVYQKDNFVFDAPHVTAGKTISVNDVTWVLRKIHIHSPAEHSIDGRSTARFECHLLHSAEDDPQARRAKLVIGTFFHLNEKAEHRPTLCALNEKWLHATANGKKCDIVHAHDIDPTEFLPADKDRKKWYRYEGSLTSEPYSEDVSWIVMEKESGIRSADICELAKCAEQPARSAYPLDRRFVLRSF